MKKLISILSTVILLASCTEQSISVQPKAVAEKTAQKPNILLLVADDTAFGDIGAYGSEVHTPNMNKIADAGIRFTNFHVSPVC